MWLQWKAKVCRRAVVRRDPETTRGALLEAAFMELHEHGTQGTSLDRILARTGLTKGALYYHFPNKDDLVLSVVDEVIATYIEQTWIRPVVEADDPLGALITSVTQSWESHKDEEIRLGCPLNRLGQESEVDSALQRRIDSVYESWRESLAQALARGIESGYVRKDACPRGLATFVIVCHQGFSSLMKGRESASELEAAVGVFVTALESYRPKGHRTATDRGRG